MTNEEMFLAIMHRMDTVETGIENLTVRMDTVETGIENLTARMDTVETGIENLTTRIDTMENNINMEFWAVRTEMDSLNKSLKQDIVVLNDKVDRIMFSKDVEGMKVRKENLRNSSAHLLR